MIGPDRVASPRRRRLVGRLRQVVGPRPGGADPRPATVVPLPRRRGPDAGRTPFDVPATPGFIGRLDELDRLVGVPDGVLRHQRVVVLAGDRGVGTSWLLCRAGHDSWEAGLLRDGRVHVDLRAGAGPGPMTGRQALDRMAEQAGLGVPPVTGSDAEAASQLRQLLSGRRILFLVDNVDRPDQLAPLLAVQCHMLVAGGPGLRGVSGATVVEVPRLDRRDAVVLCEQAHPRRHREPRGDYERGVTSIGRLFASQPKVLHELGGWGDRRRPPAAELALGLQRVLDAPPYVAVDLPDAVDAACRYHAAYATLSDPARRVARLLSMVTDPLPPAAVTALTTSTRLLPWPATPPARRRRQGDGQPGRRRPTQKPEARPGSRQASKPRSTPGSPDPSETDPRPGPSNQPTTTGTRRRPRRWTLRRPQPATPDPTSTDPQPDPPGTTPRSWSLRRPQPAPPEPTGTDTQPGPGTQPTTPDAASDTRPGRWSRRTTPKTVGTGRRTGGRRRRHPAEPTEPTGTGTRAGRWSRRRTQAAPPGAAGVDRQTRRWTPRQQTAAPETAETSPPARRRMLRRQTGAPEQVETDPRARRWRSRRKAGAPGLVGARRWRGRWKVGRSEAEAGEWALRGRWTVGGSGAGAWALRGRGRVEDALAELETAGILERRGGDIRLAPGLARLCRLHLHRDEPVRRRAQSYARLLRHLAREAARQAERLTPATATAADRAAARVADEWFARHRRLLHHLVTAPVVRHAGDSGRWRRTARIAGARWADAGQVEVALPKPRRARRAWWEVARALQAWYERRGHDRRGQALCRSVRTVAAASGMTAVEGWARHRLGVLALHRDDWAGAVDELARVGRGWGRAERAPALTNRGVALLHLGRVEEALADLRTARRLRSRRDPVGTGLTDLGLGEAWLRHGRPEVARTHLVAAANAFDGTDDAGLAASLANLVLVEAALGRMTVAVRTAAEAEHVYRELGDDAGATDVQLNTAIALLTIEPPRPEQADALLTRLITELAPRPPTPFLARVLLHAGDAARLQGRPATARLLWARAADTARKVDDPATASAATHRLAP